MSDPLRGKPSTRSRPLQLLQVLVPKLRSRSPSPQVTQSASGTQQKTGSLPSQSLHISTFGPPSTSSNAPNTGTVTQAPPATESTARSMPSENSNPQDNPYAAIGGLPTTPFVPSTLAQRAKAEGSVAYEGLKTVLQGLYYCSDMFLPLKTAAGGLLEIIKAADSVLANRKDLVDLQAKLEAILSIVKMYHKKGAIHALDHRIQMFSEAIIRQMNEVKNMLDHSLLTRTAERNKDADTILNAYQNISSLCDVFQIDTQLHIEGTVEDVLKRLESRSIERLHHEMVSYNTRHCSYGNPTCCMPGTRVKILAKLEDWASNDDASKVYWLIGMAGTGKSTISHTLCEILDGKNMLGASFFCSRASDNARNARLIIPTIAHALASTSPSIRSEIVKAIDNDPKLAEPTYINLNDQLLKLVYHPVRASIDQGIKTYKIIVIDAVDECADLQLVSSLIRFILNLAPGIPLKIFIASRDKAPIRNAFHSRDDIRKDFFLHEVEKDVVREDIEKYLTKSLAEIQERNLGSASDEWPSRTELSALLDRCGTLFIYAATAIRYINDGGVHYKARLSAMANRHGSKFQTSIDGLYGDILEQACMPMEESEVSPMRDLVSIITFLWHPLPIQAIASLSEMDAHQYLSPLTSVIHIPTHEEAAVAPFHASFPDFVTDPTRCSRERCPSFPALVASEGHQMLALNCLEFMNDSLKYNLCDIPEDLTVSRRETTNSPDSISKISPALKYACLYWASHLSEVQVPSAELVAALRNFLHRHLLHWIECLSALGELETGIKSLRSASSYLSSFKICPDLHLLFDDARRCLQMNFEVVRQHCMEIYRSALVWIPTKSLIREVYATKVNQAPKIGLGGLSNWWGPTELTLDNGSQVTSVAFSQDGNRVVSGSTDGAVRIWNATTGEVEAELTGHAGSVQSVAFSEDGSRVVSGSDDGTVWIWNAPTAEVEFSQDGSSVVSGSTDSAVWIWNATTGEVGARRRGHATFVRSVAFSQDGCRVVSGSDDGTVWIWNATTGEVGFELRAHAGPIQSVAFSQDGRRVASGSKDGTVQIWNATTGKVGPKLRAHAGSVQSVAFSQDGSRAVSGSTDGAVQIWNTTTGEVEAELTGHANSVWSVAFSQDGSRVASGSDDGTVWIWNAPTAEVEFSQDGSSVVSGSTDSAVWIWNATTGEVGARRRGHATFVRSVAFSQDGCRVVSGSDDGTVWIWNTTTGEVEAELTGHRSSVQSIAFSQDGSRVVSGSTDGAVRIWNTTMGEVGARRRGHASFVQSVAFFQDGSQVVSGSTDKTGQIWNATTGEVGAGRRGHASSVRSIAFSQDGSRVVSGSTDGTVRIWNATTGEVEAELTAEVEAELPGYVGSVWSVAFSKDGSRVVSGSDDKTVRIWNAITGNVEAELTGHTNSVWSVAFSEDGRRVVSGSTDGVVRIWNTTTGEVEAELTGHARFVGSVAFSQDGSRVVSGSNDGTVWIWSATSGEVEAELRGHASFVRSVAFSQDGSRVISGSDDKTVRIWNAITWKSDVMTTPVIILPDSSQVHTDRNAGTGKFRVVHPAQQPTLSVHLALSISIDSKWILGALRDCWIPSEFRGDGRLYSFLGGRICFGSKSGRVLILDMTGAP
ncbi:WD40-repeat-containing domain protein [Mycena sp. CBHHK59/15]|nr:WD40-repeat-containing domain protein [Mycena sp. CBHHK59/15]